MLHELKEAFLHLIYPNLCNGCGSDQLSNKSSLCLRCLDALPPTNYEKYPANPVEKIFWGRLPVINATAQFYFTKESLMQRLLHLFKYKGAKDLGLQLGRLMGFQIKASGRFDVDALIPLPLFSKRERMRGYNQAMVLCEGMAEIMDIPILPNMISRPEYTETQTVKGRLERWKNMEGKFLLKNPDGISGKHILLVDDVVTTGSTLEACGNEILKAQELQLSICTLCIAGA